MGAHRNQRRVAARLERERLASGLWPTWKRSETPDGVGAGWCQFVTHAFHNEIFAVLVRPNPDALIGGYHLAIRTVSNLEPKWAELQRIKNELFGEDRSAVQVYPKQSRLIDEADMYHLWIMPEGYEFGFGLHEDDRQ